MSRLHIVPAMMPVESRAIVRQHFRRVCQALKTGLAAKESFSNTLKRRPAGGVFHAKARALQVKLPPGRAVVLFVQVLTKKMQSLPFSVRNELFTGKNFAGFSLLLNQTAAGGQSAQ